MKKIIFLFSFFFFLNCASTLDLAKAVNTDEAFLKAIPKNSNYVILSKECSALELFNEIEDILLNRSHRILNSNKEKFYINTDSKDLGFSTNHRVNITITNENNFSKAKFYTEWMPGTEATMITNAFSGLNFTPQWTKAKAGNDRPGLAFAESAAIAKSVKNSTLQFN
jgi:hypothetical protein